MPCQCDVIIIGAGIGGLTAAARLVQEGLRVLILDKNSHPGGTAYVFHRKGFTFPMGPLGFSTPDVVQRTLRELGEKDDLKLVRIHYSICAFGVSLPISLPFSRLKTKFTEIFPADAIGIDRFFQKITEILNTFALPDNAHRRSILQKATGMPARDYLSRNINDFRLRRILGSQGTDEAYSSLPLLAAMWNLMGNEGIWYPEGGMRSFCERFVRAATVRNGQGGKGEIRLGSEVKRIRIQDGNARGVVLSDGTAIDADSIVSNADFKTTFLNLIDPDNLPEKAYRSIAGAKQAGSVLQVCLGVDRSGADFSAFDTCSRIIYRRPGDTDEPKTLDVDWTDRLVEPDAFAKQEMEISLWSKEDPALSPEGGASVVIRVGADYPHFARYRSGPRRRLSGYPAYKQRLGYALVREAERIIPWLSNAVRVMDVATPLTFQDQGGRSQGTVAGWSWNFEDNPAEASVELIRTPVRGLYMAGYQAYSTLFMGGIPTAVESGNRAAKAVLECAEPVEEVRLPGNAGSCG